MELLDSGGSACSNFSSTGSLATRRQANYRKKLCEEQLRIVREKNRLRAAQKRANETAEEKIMRNLTERAKAFMRRQTETMEEKLQRRERERQHAALKRKMETAEKREQRLQLGRHRAHLRRRMESPESRERRLKKGRERIALRRKLKKNGLDPSLLGDKRYGARTLPQDVACNRPLRLAGQDSTSDPSRSSSFSPPLLSCPSNQITPSLVALAQGYTADFSNAVLLTEGTPAEETNFLGQLHPQPEVSSPLDEEEKLQDLSDNADMQSRRIFPRQPVIELEKQEHNVSKLRELLRQEETKLQALRYKRGQQSTSSVSSKATETQRGGVIHSVQGAGNLQVSSSGKAKVTEEPTVDSNGGQQSSAPAISSRLQQLVDSIATDKVSSKKTAAVPHSSQQLMVTTSSLINHMQTSLSVSQQQVGKPAPKSTSPPEVITIPDTPSPSSPPALIHNHTSLPSAIQVPTISSAHHKQHSRSESPQLDEEAIMKAVESSKKYREFIMKQAAVRRSFQKTIDKRMSNTPYPKTFRQVWPIIPVHDSSFVKNLGLEMVTMYFDPNWKAVHSKPPPATKVKPVCNQCGCDFASAWQIRKNNSKQVLLCESCDFTNLKLLQRTKLASQLKELIEEIRKEETKFLNECRDAKKQVVEMEKEAILSSHKAFGKTLPVQPSVITQQSTREARPLYASIQSSNHIFPAGAALEAVQQLPSKAVQIKPGLVQLPVSSELTRAVVPSILSSQLSKPFIPPPSVVSSNSVKDAAVVAAAIDVSRKRKSPEVVDNPVPPRKLSKTSQQLDSTLDHITRQLLHKQVGEKCKKQRKPDHAQEPQPSLGKKQSQEQGNTAIAGKPTLSVNHDPPSLAPSVPLIDIAAPPSPPVVLKGSSAATSERNSPGCEGTSADSRRSRRKGKPRQNRVQSNSSNTE